MGHETRNGSVGREEGALSGGSEKGVIEYRWLHITTGRKGARKSGRGAGKDMEEEDQQSR